MKKGLAIFVILLLLVVAGLIYFIPSQQPPALVRVLGTTTISSQRYVILSFTNATRGEIAWTPHQSIVFTNGGKFIMPQLTQPTNWIGFTAVLKPATDCTVEVPIPEGAVRWSLDFNVTFQTPLTRVLDVAHNWQLATPGTTGKRTSFGSPKRVTTGDLPP